MRVRGFGLRKFSAAASMPNSLAFLLELLAAEQFDWLKSLTFFGTLGIWPPMPCGAMPCHPVRIFAWLLHEHAEQIRYGV